jgi:hypothetical protein
MDIQPHIAPAPEGSTFWLPVPAGWVAGDRSRTDLSDDPFAAAWLSGPDGMVRACRAVPAATFVNLRSLAEAADLFTQEPASLLDMLDGGFRSGISDDGPAVRAARLAAAIELGVDGFLQDQFWWTARHGADHPEWEFGRGLRVETVLSVFNQREHRCIVTADLSRFSAVGWVSAREVVAEARKRKTGGRGPFLSGKGIEPYPLAPFDRPELPSPGRQQAP